MKFILTFLLAEMVAIITAISAGVLAYHGKSGWGWFLAISFISQVTYNNGGKQ